MKKSDLAHLFQYQEVASTSSQKHPRMSIRSPVLRRIWGGCLHPVKGFPLPRGESKHRLAIPGTNKAATGQLVFFQHCGSWLEYYPISNRKNIFNPGPFSTAMFVCRSANTVCLLDVTGT